MTHGPAGSERGRDERRNAGAPEVFLRAELTEAGIFSIMTQTHGI